MYTEYVNRLDRLRSVADADFKDQFVNELQALLGNCDAPLLHRSSVTIESDIREPYKDLGAYGPTPPPGALNIFTQQPTDVSIFAEGISILNQLVVKGEIIGVHLEATATDSWTAGNPATVPATDDATGLAIIIELPVGKGEDPNVETGNPLLYVKIGARNIAVEGHADRYIGCIEAITDIAKVRQGWGLMDGTANSAANGGSEINYVGSLVKGAANGAGDINIEQDTGTTVTGVSVGNNTGGLVANSADIGITINNNTGGLTANSSTAGVTTDGAGNHAHTGMTGAGSALISSNVTGISVLDHASHAHSLGSTVQNVDANLDGLTLQVTETVDACTSTESTAGCGGLTTLSHSVTDAGHMHSDTGHMHGITAETDHTHTMTDTGHTHTIDAHGHTYIDPGHTHTIDAHDHPVVDGGHFHTPGEPETKKMIWVERLNNAA